MLHYSLRQLPDTLVDGAVETESLGFYGGAGNPGGHQGDVSPLLKTVSMRIAGQKVGFG